jgi:hypothetical protein
MKNRKKPESFYILGYLMELMKKYEDLDFFFICDKFGSFFPMENPLYRLKSYFSG